MANKAIEQWKLDATDWIHNTLAKRDRQKASDVAIEGLQRLNSFVHQRCNSTGSLVASRNIFRTISLYLSG
jgi:hypothetical protein